MDPSQGLPTDPPQPPAHPPLRRSPLCPPGAGRSPRSDLRAKSRLPLPTTLRRLPLPLSFLSSSSSSSSSSPAAPRPAHTRSHTALRRPGPHPSPPLLGRIAGRRRRGAPGCAAPCGRGLNAEPHRPTARPRGSARPGARTQAQPPRRKLQKLPAVPPPSPRNGAGRPRLRAGVTRGRGERRPAPGSPLLSAGAEPPASFPTIPSPQLCPVLPRRPRLPPPPARWRRRRRRGRPGEVRPQPERGARRGAAPRRPASLRPPSPPPARARGKPPRRGRAAARQRRRSPRRSAPGGQEPGPGHTPRRGGAEGARGSRYRGQCRLPPRPPPALTFAL